MTSVQCYSYIQSSVDTVGVFSDSTTKRRINAKTHTIEFRDKFAAPHNELYSFGHTPFNDDVQQEHIQYAPHSMAMDFIIDDMFCYFSI